MYVAILESKQRRVHIFKHSGLKMQQNLIDQIQRVLFSQGVKVRQLKGKEKGPEKGLLTDIFFLPQIIGDQCGGTKQKICS